MHCISSPARIRLAIDSRINRDLISAAQQQGFTFSNPADDFPIWNAIADADLENPACMCSPEVAEWLVGKAIEATLHQLYSARQLTDSERNHNPP